ncbi:DUF802 domain-containing protein [Pseudoxanthomonas sp. 10H]|uniref:DUF802 domain-containing protein n=1 Tax=Pseudoxanthomonas sp. 10H TaxID=3242729 RepID=UPI003557163A
MTRHSLRSAPLFLIGLAGLAVVAWIGAGYVGSNALGVAVILVIGAGYLAGGLELYRYRQATGTLAAALEHAASAGTGLGDWLERLHPGLREAVRLRVEGERVALPAPALTPYLVGLLVLLGMLGTLLGMMATLRGTGLALESAADLDAIRGSLAAPVKGLGFAFGTSIAGVASSAMLGLLSALVRRERVQVVQRLDAAIATSLRVHSRAHQREESFRLLQAQAGLMPALVDRLEATMAALERRDVATGERLLAGQAALHASTEAAHARLASAFEQSLQAGASASARAVGEALQPAVQATLDGLARGAAAMQDSMARAVRDQLDGLASGFAGASAATAASWDAALAAQQEANARLAADLHAGLERFAATFEQRSSALLDGVAARMDGEAARVAEAWQQAQARQEAAGAALAERSAQALASVTAGLQERAAALVEATDRSHAQLQQQLATQDAQRLEAWSARLAATGAALREDWERAGADAAARQQSICDALAASADAITAQAQAHARETIAEIGRLVQAASEAPRAAAEVIAELRQKLSDSMVRDGAMLEERNQMMATLDTLLAAVNHASTEQRAAIDALVATSAELLDRVGTRFGEQVAGETGKLEGVSAQVAVAATEVASLGEAFASAVQTFGEGNAALIDRLQAIEGALDRSLARSDEQLAYYVAQAREVVDLSMLAQRQIMADLQQLGGARAIEAETA